jgi:hypothetical protein
VGVVTRKRVAVCHLVATALRATWCPYVHACIYAPRVNAILLYTPWIAALSLTVATPLVEPIAIEVGGSIDECRAEPHLSL